MDGLRVVIYPNDHRPAHVHVIGNGCEAVFNLNCPNGPNEWRICAPSGARFMAVRKDEFEAANARGAARLAKTPTAISARYDRRIGRVVIELSTGLGIAFKPHSAQGLEKATPTDLAEIEISPSGLGLHIPALDADLYLPALLEGFLGSRKWMAATMGKAGGQTSTEAKAAAARANGKLGGRPKKVRETARP